MAAGLMQRVVVTGMGCVTPLGSTVDAYWQALCAGNSGVRQIDWFDASAFSCQIAARATGFDAYIDKKDRFSRFIQFAVIASQQAVGDAGLDIATIATDCGVEIGSGMGGIEILEAAADKLKTRGPSRISPFTVPMMITDMAAGVVSIKLGAKGPNAASVTACASAAHAIGRAMHSIATGEAVAMIAGGSEAVLTPLGVGAFCAARSLSTQNSTPQTASRPFDGTRDGFVMGEGAGILVLESRDHALKRGAKIYAELVGFGSAADAYHITAPDPSGDGAVRAMRAAVQHAGITPDQVGYINAHGTSTRLNDAIETKAIKQVFGSNIVVSSTKSMTGHLLGAAAAIEAIASIQALIYQQVPPTINYQTPDPDCDLDYVPNTARSVQGLTYVASNSLGFGGHNATLLFKKA